MNRTTDSDMKPAAFLFDLNGTMVDDMPYHVNAWFQALNNLGYGVTLERVKQESYGKNHEVLERLFPARLNDVQKEKVSQAKEELYRQQVVPSLKLIDGLAEWLEKWQKAGIKMAIASAAILSNVDLVLDGLHIRHYFDAIVSADDVSLSKPDPETFLKAAVALRIPPSRCIVFEDSPKGVEAAKNAGMKAVVLTTQDAPAAFKDFDNILFCAADYRSNEFSRFWEEICQGY